MRTPNRGVRSDVPPHSRSTMDLRPRYDSTDDGVVLVVETSVVATFSRRRQWYFGGALVDVPVVKLYEREGVSCNVLLSTHFVN